jgi:uncharacterized protein YbjQ (UPF0145 family)
MTDFCAHGIIQQGKFGLDHMTNGYAICRGCGKPTFESVQQTSAPLLVQQPTPVLVVTMNDVPGYTIDEVHGDVFGLIVRVRNTFSNFGASLRSVVGGEVGGYTKLLSESRIEARERLVDEARRLGANAVVAMRFDCNEIGDIMSEIAAYGTAVTISKVPTPTPTAGLNTEAG